MRAAAVVALGLATTGCGDQSANPVTGSPTSPSPALSGRGASLCTSTPDFVVDSDASLRAALAAAKPGDVIGLDGSIGISEGVEVGTEDLTLTCTTPGSGLYASQQSEMFFLVTVTAPGVTVSGLKLDATGTWRGPYYALNNGDNAQASAVRFTGNEVICGPGECAFFVGSQDATITDNSFTSRGSATGIHLQGNTTNAFSSGIDGTRIERNTVNALKPSTIGVFGGIRPRDGSNIVVADNVVTGPWANSVSALALTGSELEGNRLENAARFGLGINLFGALRASDNTIRNNQIRGAGEAGLFARLACGNVLVGNNLAGNAGNTAAIFHATSGGNVLLGNSHGVIDNGSFDCDGDGTVDPNRLTGRIQRGVQLGAVVSDAVAGSRGGPALR